MSYRFGKLWHLAIIWAIRKAFQCILQGVRFLLANHTLLSRTLRVSHIQIPSKPVGYQASSKIVAIKLIIIIMIITVTIIVIVIIKIRTILRKMSSLDGGSAPQFTTHQSCNPHKCQMKEVRSFLDTSFCSCKLTELFVQFLFVTTTIFLVS